ncbi:DUF1904 family protein [Paenibacillus apiarius]|uniref:DUF1904 domain-containing protein n=1 Tax=Paenibacillus apiarius TaxID=46240 RepID=A0ABT4DRV1_9BACL|nr:DUF1904 family protein [Paenibacillus apiarius]MCY9514325.1 DUF1904 domain-containing protein [Paenibacillus apiarius]MCY9520092.1 DUF1904 domain-containing protein [Paenibacillus apiarius]MCY9550099.1 DUF1904 domain-containing protein [Paenibacillus apiarius]MCY9560290.1 DUF1904 domain-containing protein [Paenibacillus apiarius]MCY9683188.1 DUF1904 domain-containing protein [Paenibacillus apiarius]
MPFIRFKGFKQPFVERISSAVIHLVADTVHIPPEIVKIELIHAIPVANSPLSVEIYMFQREQEKHDAVASKLYALLQEHGYDQVHIFYVILTPSLYYKEGKPLQGVPVIPEAADGASP